MNYQEKLRIFIEDYATAVFDNKDIIVSLETSYEDKTIGLYCHEKEKSTLLLQYEFGANHEVDESDGDESPKYFLLGHPIEYIKNYSTPNKFDLLFGRYCNIFSANYVISDLPYTVSGESFEINAPQIYKNLSNDYREILLKNSSPFKRFLKVKSNCNLQFEIESIEEQ